MSTNRRKADVPSTEARNAQPTDDGSTWTAVGLAAAVAVALMVGLVILAVLAAGAVFVALNAQQAALSSQVEPRPGRNGPAARR